MHIGNFRDVPLIEVSVEGGSICKHCCKKRRPITITVNAQEKKAQGRTLIKNTVIAQRRLTFFTLHTSLHKPKPPVNLLESQDLLSEQNETNFIRKSRNDKKPRNLLSKSRKKSHKGQ